MKVLLIDLSSLAHSHFHIHGADADPNKTSDSVVDRVRSLAHGHDRVALAIDCGKSFRADIDPKYKATRGERPAALYCQYDRAVEVLEKDGMLALKAPGFEADDVLSTAVKFLREQDPPADVTVATADKDLTQLCAPGVSIFSLTKNVTMGEAEVTEKFGVRPNQMRDYLALVGDASDNIIGVRGIGPKGAAKLLAKYGTLANMWREIVGKTAEQTGLPPATHKALTESTAIVDLACQLITLRTDAPIDCAKILEHREQKPLCEVHDAEFADEGDEPMGYEEDERAAIIAESAEADAAKVVAKPATIEAGTATAAEATTATTPATEKEPGATTESEPTTTSLALVQAEWSEELEPRTMNQAVRLATIFHNSRVFSAWGNAQANLAVIMAGREKGLGAFSSMAAFHNIDGKPRPSADLMAALCKRSPLCEYFRPIEIADDHATVEVKRRGDPPVRINYTVEDAKRAKLIKPGGGWEKNPRQMCLARAKSDAAHAVFEDIVLGLYCPEDFAQ